MIQRTTQAEEDLIEIWIYIAQDNPGATDRVLADNPLMGRLRPNIAPELRYFTVGNYLILYRTVRDGIQIVRVIHGARDLPNSF